MVLKIIALSVLTEALVELIFSAAPLQGVRAWLIKKTPCVRSTAQGHLLECKYCTSVWIAAAVVVLFTFADYQITRLAATALIVARLSNYCHLLISTVRDEQINKRLERK